MTPDRPPIAPVTLEDLLRLKRAERPPAAFWSRFEQDLRAKQLAAIVEKRPWWHAPYLLGRRAYAWVQPLQVPVGAAALLVFTLMVAREQLPAPASESAVVAEGVQASAPVVVARVEPVAARVALASVPVESATQAAEAEPARVAALLGELSPTSSLTSLIPWATRVDAPSAPVTPSRHVIEEGLETLRPSSLRVAPLLAGFAPRGEDAGYEVADAEIAASVRSVAQGVSARAQRRSRLLASLDSAELAGELDSGAGVRERITSGLSAEQLYDSARRLGVDGGRLTLKF